MEREMRSRPRVRPLVMCLVVVTAFVLGGTTVHGGGAARVAQASPSLGSDPTPTNAEERRACEDGNLLIGDLPSMDGRWERGVTEGTEKAAAWHPDAQLVGLRVNCALFEPGFRWQTSFYSGEAQAIHATDTGESVPVNLEPEQVPELDLSDLSFSRLRDALNAEGFTDDLVLSPTTGVDIRMNYAEARFGPAEAPLGQTLAHVSISRLGEIKDVFIDVSTGQVYRYSMPTG